MMEAADNWKFFKAHGRRDSAANAGVLAEGNKSKRNRSSLRERHPLKRVTIAMTMDIFEGIPPRLALKSLLRVMHDIHQDLAADATVDRVRATMDASAAAATVIEKRRIVVRPVLLLSPRPRVVVLDPLPRPSRGKWSTWEVTILR